MTYAHRHCKKIERQISKMQRDRQMGESYMSIIVSKDNLINSIKTILGSKLVMLVYGN